MEADIQKRKGTSEPEVVALHLLGKQDMEFLARALGSAVEVSKKSKREQGLLITSLFRRHNLIEALTKHKLRREIGERRAEYSAMRRTAERLSRTKTEHHIIKPGDAQDIYAAIMLGIKGLAGDNESEMTKLLENITYNHK